MKLSELRLSVKEVVAICALVFTLGGAAVSFNSMLDTMGEMSKKLVKLTETVQKLTIEQQRINMIVNFMYAKNLKDGWTPPNWTGPSIVEEGS